MTAPTRDSLDRFETALLDELRAQVSHRAPAAPARPPRRALVGSLAAATVAAVGGVALWPTPAYAVSRDDSGAVTVTVNRLEGSAALERELTRYGIASQVTYLPSGQRCQPDRYADVTPKGSILGVSSQQFTVLLPPGAVGSHETFVLSASVTPMPDQDGFRASVDFGVARGAVAPCEPRPVD